MNNAQFDPELLSAYLDGELTDRQRATVEAWLSESDEVRRTLEQLRAASAALKKLPRPTLGESFTNQLMKEIAARPQGRPPGTLHKPLRIHSADDGKPPSVAPRAAAPNTLHFRWWPAVATGGIAAAVLATVWLARPREAPVRLAQGPIASRAPAELAGKDAVAADRLTATEPAEAEAEAFATDLDAQARRASPSGAGATRAAKIGSDRVGGPRNEKDAPLEAASELHGRALSQSIRRDPKPKRTADDAAEAPRAERLDEALQREPLVQSLAALNPELAVNEVDYAGAAVVTVTTTDNAAGLRAIQNALLANGIVQDQPLQQGRAAPAPALRAPTEVTRDAVYVEAQLHQLEAALDALRSGRDNTGIKLLKLQSIHPEMLRQQLAGQMGLPATENFSLGVRPFEKATGQNRRSGTAAAKDAKAPPGDVQQRRLQRKLPGKAFAGRQVNLKLPRTPKAVQAIKSIGRSQQPQRQRSAPRDEPAQTAAGQRAASPDQPLRYAKPPKPSAVDAKKDTSKDLGQASVAPKKTGPIQVLFLFEPEAEAEREPATRH